jgi:hypothetical protein
MLTGQPLQALLLFLLLSQKNERLNHICLEVSARCGNCSGWCVRSS